tara:strand:+ start:581 stop:778 length:198 start_codon:yes stop_codon:yes gene_type:complete
VPCRTDPPPDQPQREAEQAEGGRDREAREKAERAERETPTTPLQIRPLWTDYLLYNLMTSSIYKT